MNFKEAEKMLNLMVINRKIQSPYIVNGEVKTPVVSEGILNFSTVEWILDELKKTYIEIHGQNIMIKE